MAEKRENAHMWVTVMGGGFSILYGLVCALREVDVPFLLLFILRLVFDIYSVQCRNELYLSSRKPIPSELYPFRNIPQRKLTKWRRIFHTHIHLPHKLQEILI